MLYTIILTDIYKYEVAKTMFQYYHHCLPAVFSEYFQPVSTVHSHNTRAASKVFFKPRFSNHLCKSSIKYVGVEIWNEIPDNFKDCSSRVLKKSYRQF